MTHDRIFRFEPTFATPDQATRFATSQALAWIDTTGNGIALPSNAGA